MTEGMIIFFTVHRKNYPARNPVLTNQQHDDEVRKIEPTEGLLELSTPPDSRVKFGSPPRSREEGRETKYLWVIGLVDIPIALENSKHSLLLSRGYLSHTNLTGREKAHTAGELWFQDANTVIVNGGSSRYTPRDEEELTSVARALKEIGYNVASMGWDTDTNSPARVVHGAPKWL